MSGAGSVRVAGGLGEASAAPSRSAAGVYCALLLTACAASSGITVIYNLLPTLQRTFPGQPALAWVVTIYWLFSAVAAAVCGRLGDVAGRRKVLIIVLMLCAAGALVSASAPNLAWLIVGCAIQGAASAITPLSFGIFRDNLPPERVPVAVGVLTAAGTVAAGLIFVGSGVVIDRFSWHGGFLFKVVISAVALIAVLALVPRSEPIPGRRIDLIRGVLFGPGLAALLVGVQQIHGWGLADARLWGLFGLGVVILALWVRHQLRVPDPLIDLRMLRNPQIALANLCMVIIVLGAIQIGQILTLFFQQPRWTGTGLGLTATGSGMMHLALDMVAIVAAPWSGKIAARYGARQAALLGFSIIITAWTGLALFHVGQWITLAGAALALSGYAVTAAAMYNLIIESTPRERTSEATGLTYVFFTAFFAVGAQIVFALLNTSRITDPPRGDFPSDAAFTLGFGYIAATGVLGLLLATRLPRRKAHEAAA